MCRARRRSRCACRRAARSSAPTRRPAPRLPRTRSRGWLRRAFVPSRTRTVTSAPGSTCAGISAARWPGLVSAGGVAGSAPTGGGAAATWDGGGAEGRGGGGGGGGGGARAADLRGRCVPAQSRLPRDLTAEVGPPVSPSARRRLVASACAHAEGQPAAQGLEHAQLAEVVGVVDRVVGAELERVPDVAAGGRPDRRHRRDVDDEVVVALEEPVDEALAELGPPAPSGTPGGRWLSSPRVTWKFELMTCQLVPGAG